MTMIADTNLFSTVQTVQAMNPGFSCQKRFKVHMVLKPLIFMELLKRVYLISFLHTVITEYFV